MMDLDKIWKSKISISLKLRLVETTVFSVATYGSKGCTMKTTDRKRIEGLLGIRWSDRGISLCVLQKLTTLTRIKLLASMFQRKLPFFGLKMRRSCLNKDIILAMVQGKRPPTLQLVCPRPARVWVDDITELLVCTLATAVQAAQDRTHWRHLVSTTLVLLGTTWLNDDAVSWISSEWWTEVCARSL